MAALCQKSCDFQSPEIGSITNLQQFASILPISLNFATYTAHCSTFSILLIPTKKIEQIPKKPDRGQVKFEYLKGSSPSEELWFQSPETRNVTNLQQSASILPTLLNPQRTQHNAQPFNFADPSKKIKRFQRNQTKMTAILPSPNNTVRDALDACKVHSSRIFSLFNFVNANKKDWTTSNKQCKINSSPQQK